MQRVQRLFGGFVLAALLSIAGAVNSSAQPLPTEPAPTRPSDAPLPSCLDQTIKDQLGAELKPRGVQKRDFIKNKKIVVLGHGGLFGGDLTSSSWIAGGSLGMFVTRALTVRLDLRDVMAVEEISGETRYTNNIVATAGLALYIPSGL